MILSRAELPSSCSWPGLAGTEHARKQPREWEVSFHLNPAAVFSLHIPHLKSLVAGVKGVLQLLLALDSSYAQLLVQCSSLFSSLLVFFFKVRSR